MTDRGRRPWWMHVLLSPWYLLKLLWALLDLGEGLYYLLLAVAVLALLVAVASLTVWNFLFS